MNLWLGSLLALVLALPAHGQLTEKTRARLDSLLTAAQARGTFSGCVAVGQSGQVVYERCLGRAGGQALTREAVFPLASISKALAAAVAYKQMEMGRLSLDGPLARWLPEAPAAWARGLTLRRLLTHTSGLPAYDWACLNNGQLSPAQVVAYHARRAPGRVDSFAYNNLDYIVLELVLARASGHPQGFAGLLKELLPANSHVTPFGQAPGVLTQAVEGGKGKVLNKGERSFLEMATAAAGLAGRSADLVALDARLLPGGYLADSSLRQMAAPYPAGGLVASGSWSYDYPFAPGKPATLERRGSFGGFSHVWYRWPGRRLTLVALANTDAFNTDSFGDFSQLKEQLVRALLME